MWSKAAVRFLRLASQLLSKRPWTLVRLTVVYNGKRALYWLYGITKSRFFEPNRSEMMRIWTQPPKKRVRKEETSNEGSVYESDSHSAEEILDSDDLDAATPPPSSQTTKRTAKKSINGKKSPEKKASSKPKETGKTATSNGSPKKKKTTAPNKKRKRANSEEEDGGEDSYELIGEIVQAPTAGRGTHACTVGLVSLFIDLQFLRVVSPRIHLTFWSN